MGEEEENQENKPGPAKRVWLLVDHSSREASLIPVANGLEQRGYSVELVTITEVIGSVAREALAGGAERLLRGLRVAVRGRSGDEDLVGAIRRRQPDVLVVTEARYARAIGVLENLTGVESLQVGLIPDFYVDQAWFNGQLHAFIVPDEATFEQVVERGFPEDRVQIAGPALRPNFQTSVDVEAARREFGFSGDQQVVLIRADGFDSDTLEKLLFQCTLCDRDVRYIFHHDGDGATASTLRRAAEEYGLPAAMFGRVQDLERYVAAVDAVLASEEDRYLPEVLESQTPALLMASSLEASGNGEALAEQELADYLDDIGQLGTRLDRFLKTDHLEKRKSKLGEWDGVTRHNRLVDALEEAAKNAQQWRRTQRPESTEADEPKTEEEITEPPGPFEPIGSRAGKSTTEEGSTDRGGEDKPRDRSTGADYSRLSRAEAKEQLAELILKERDHERRLKELEKQQERWRGRLQLAREWKETDLAEEAEGLLRGYIEDAGPLEEQLVDIRRQKKKLKAAARGSGRKQEQYDGTDEDPDRASQLEDRFRKMEVDSDLEGLKDRIRRELGE